jgi:hypothetical protein
VYVWLRTVVRHEASDGYGEVETPRAASARALLAAPFLGAAPATVVTSPIATADDKTAATSTFARRMLLSRIGPVDGPSAFVVDRAGNATIESLSHKLDGTSHLSPAIR